ncbi:MAG: hypothetical protein ACR2RL_16850 [Gammaproteobacteria bacterium]
MNISSTTVAITALAMAAISAWVYILASDDAEAFTAQQTKAVSGNAQLTQISPIIRSASHDAATQARLRALDQKIGVLHDQSDTTTQRADSRIDQLALEVASLRAELGYLTNELAANIEAEGPVADDEKLGLSEEEKQAKAIQDVEDQLATYDDEGIQEGADPLWAPRARTQLYESFEGLRAHGIGVGEVSCHSSFCKAEFFIDSDDTNTAMRHLQDVAPWGGESMVWIKDVELGRGVIYVAREGEILPQS